MEICIESIFRDAIPYVVDTVVYTAYDAGRRFINKYDKRRDVGFTPWPSVKGSFQETKRYYCDTIMGRTFIEDKAAVYFVNGRKEK